MLISYANIRYTLDRPQEEMPPKAKVAKPTGVAGSNFIAAELDAAGDRNEAQKSQPAKKNYAQNFSNALARKVADSLRPAFKGILPDEHGRGSESRARTAKGFKKLDVNYSTLELGLALGVSIKSVNFPEANGNYAKNVTRVDNELRAEAEDYHSRQPFAVLVALYFSPKGAAENATAKKPSSFGHMVKTLRYRGRRRLPTQSSSLFEKIYVGLYEPDGPERGRVGFFDVELDPPWKGVPNHLLSFREVMEQIRIQFDSRNETGFNWADRGELRDDPSTSRDESLGDADEAD